MHPIGREQEEQEGSTSEEEDLGEVPEDGDGEDEESDVGEHDDEDEDWLPPELPEEEALVAERLVVAARDMEEGERDEEVLEVEGRPTLPGSSRGSREGPREEEPEQGALVDSEDEEVSTQELQEGLARLRYVSPDGGVVAVERLRRRQEKLQEREAAMARAVALLEGVRVEAGEAGEEEEGDQNEERAVMPGLEDDDGGDSEEEQDSEDEDELEQAAATEPPPIVAEDDWEEDGEEPPALVGAEPQVIGRVGSRGGGVRVEAPALLQVAGTGRQGPGWGEELGAQEQVLDQGDRPNLDERLEHAGQLSEAEAIGILAMPPQLQESEKIFLLGRSPGTRNMWLSLHPSLRTKAAASRKHAEQVRARTTGGPVVEQEEQGGGEREVEQEEGIRVNNGTQDGGSTQDSEGSQAAPLPAAGDLPTLDEVHRQHIPTHKFPPKAARGEFSRELASLWSRLANNMGENRLWIMALLFTRVILPAGRGPRQGDAYSQSRLVRDRLRRWRGGEVRQLWDEAVELTRPRPRVGRRRRGAEAEEKTQEERNAVRAATLAGEGQYTRSLQALTSAGLADHSRDSVRKMEAKHPEATQELGPLPTTDTNPISFTQLDVYKAAQRFRKGSAPGPSGLRPEHLKIALQAAPNRKDKALQALTRLVNKMAAGEVPATVAPYLSGERLHAANKKDGGIRPIAVGNILRRLVSKCISYDLSDRAATLLSPHQLGVGVRGGCEAIVHAVRETLDKDGTKWVLQGDLINAFNVADRGTALSEVADKFPEALAWVSTTYGAPSHLMFGDTHISSETGFHQGDPLASLLFSLVLQPVVKMIEQEVPGLKINAWFLDDGVQVGTKEELEKVVQILKREGPGRGLTLSTAETVTHPAMPKTTVWSPLNPKEDTDPLQQGVSWVRDQGITLLGAPVGFDNFIRESLQKRVDKVREITALLPNLKDPHTEYALLKSCLSLPKLMFSLRTFETRGLQDLLKEFDRLTREALTRILGSPVPDLQWQQAKLPVSMGGLGLRAAEDHAPAAYATSYIASQPLVRQLLGTQHNRKQLPPSGRKCWTPSP